MKVFSNFAARRVACVKFLARVLGVVLWIPSALLQMIGEYGLSLSDTLLEWRSVEQLAKIEQAEIDDALFGDAGPNAPVSNRTSKLLDSLAGTDPSKPDPVVISTPTQGSSFQPWTSSRQKLRIAEFDDEQPDEPAFEEEPSAEVENWRECLKTHKHGSPNAAARQWINRGDKKAA